MEQLLSTKLYLPPPRPERVPRPGLLSQLNKGLGRRLTLISAPAGFGKTSLVSEWVENLRRAAQEENQSTYRVAWVSLDEGDNDPVRFLVYLIAAMNQLHEGKKALGEGAMSMLQSPQPPPAETVLISLINEIAALSTGVLLVLDDYHLLETESIHQVVTFLLEHQPPQLQLVIVTRIDPPLPLPRLRARGHLAELRAADLRFTSAEAAEFLNRVMGLNLSEEDVVALETRTEGWIAGLQLAAVSIRGSEDTSAFIQSFSGSHRYILDYLIEEVLEQQSETIQRFLLQTSILERLNGDLCTAVTGKENQQEILEYLEHANLFIVPLDQEQQWYRYHHLFAELLRKRLKQTLAEQLPTLHERASHWYALNGFVGDAIEHSLKAKDFEQAARLTEASVDYLWERGEHAKLQNLFSRLPAASINARPQLCVYNAWYSFVKGEQEIAQESLKAAAKVLEHRSAGIILSDEISSSRQEIGRQRGRIAAVQTFMKAHQGDVEGLINLAQQALNDLAKEDRVWRSLTAITLGDVYGFRGDMTDAYDARHEAYAACQESGEGYYCMLAGMKLAITLRAQGRLGQAMEVCRQQIQVGKDYRLSQTPMHGLLLIIWAEVRNELNDQEAAFKQATTGLALTRSSTDMTILGWGYMCMARILFSRQEFSELADLFHELEGYRSGINVPPWVENQILAWRTRLALTQDNLFAANQWGQDRGLIHDGKTKAPEEVDYFAIIEYIMLARVLMAQNRPDEAVDLLTQLHSAAAAGGQISRMIEIRNLMALAFQAIGNLEQAIASLEQALTLAEPEGFVRTFVDEGPPMAHLLYKALPQGSAPDYIRRLLAAFPVDEMEQPGIKKRQTQAAELIEPLSEREIEVLELIADGLTNREIAAKLYVTLNTVKAHTRNIYGKLEVNSRTKAVHKAKSLGVLSSQ